MIYRLLIMLGLLLGAVAIWLTLTPRQVGPVNALSSGPAQPEQGYSATDASLIETGPDGRPMYTLQAKQITQDANSDIVNLATVQMTFRDSAGGQWQARADRAQARQDSAQVDMDGAINVSGLFSGSDQPARLLTETLHVDTHSEVIRTRSAVNLNWAGIVVDARGLYVNMKDNNIKLESDVHGRFAR